MLRGDVYEFRPLRSSGHQQQGRRYAVIVQANELLPRSVVLVAPTSTSARAASFRPEIDLLGNATRVLVEQLGAVDVGRLGELVDHVSHEQQWGIDEALLTILGLRLPRPGPARESGRPVRMGMWHLTWPRSIPQA